MCTLKTTKTLFLLVVFGFAAVSFYQFHQRVNIPHAGSPIKHTNRFHGKIQLHHRPSPVKHDTSSPQKANPQAIDPINVAKEPKPKTNEEQQTTSSSTYTSSTTQTQTGHQNASTSLNSTLQPQQSTSPPGYTNTTKPEQQTTASSNNTSSNSQQRTGQDNTTSNASQSSGTERKSKMYAVYGCSTPTLETYRSYDYAFYLPLTALAWERLNYSSIVLLVGKKEDWEKDAALQLVLQALSQRDARVILLDAAPENRVMLSQTSRLFVANMKQAALNDDDYVLTSDADVWPLRCQHFARKPGYSLSLVHSQCCGTFQHKEKNYTMLPMCHIGATVKVWKNIVNRNESAAYDAETILRYFEAYFGKEAARKAVEFGSAEWYLDQKLASILITEWTEQNHAQPKIHKVSDEGFDRIDRAEWDVGKMDAQSLEQMYDAHLLESAYEPKVWSTVLPLVKLMYGNDSVETKWCNKYAADFAQGIEAVRNKTKA